MKALFALTFSLLVLVASDASASADASGRVCTISQACATITAQLVSASHPYSGTWSDVQRPETGLAAGQLQLAVRVQWDEVNPNPNDSAEMAAVLSELPLTLHADGSSSPVSAELEQAGPNPVLCMPSCDQTPGDYYSFFQLSAPIDVTSYLAAAKGQHTFSLTIGDANVDTNSLSMTATASVSGRGKTTGRTSDTSQVCDSSGLCGSVALNLDTSDAPSQWAPAALETGMLGVYATVTFDTTSFIPQSAAKSSDMFANRPLTLHVGSRSFLLRQHLSLGPLPSDAKSMWCDTDASGACAKPVRYYAVWRLESPIKLSHYLPKYGNADVWFSTVADDGSTISSNKLDETGNPVMAPNGLSLTKLGRRTIKMTVTSAQFRETHESGRLELIATRSDGGNWLRYRVTTKLITVHPGARSVSATFHLPVAGRWCFQVLGAIIYGGRPHVVYAAPKYLTVK